MRRLASRTPASPMPRTHWGRRSRPAAPRPRRVWRAARACAPPAEARWAVTMRRTSSPSGRRSDSMGRRDRSRDEVVPMSEADRLERLWAGGFGDDYVDRNLSQYDERAPFWDSVLERFLARRA